MLICEQRLQTPTDDHLADSQSREFGNEDGQSARSKKMVPISRTLFPTVTGASTIGLVFEGGIILASDTLGSYGSMARFRGVERLVKLGDHTVFGCSGELSDFQRICRILKEEAQMDWYFGDGHCYRANHYASLLSRILYYRRCSLNPLWNSVVLAGFVRSNKLDSSSSSLTPYLSYVDIHGTILEDNCVATGMGRYLALPLLRTAPLYIDENAAKKVVEDCMKVLYYRDVVAAKHVQMAIITSTDIRIDEPYLLNSKWDHKDFISATCKVGTTGSCW